MKNIILASASPRRIELLKEALHKFKVIPSSVKERFDNASPEENAMRLAKAKASDVAAHNRYSLVIGADTVVWTRKEILGKPNDEADALRILRLLNGKEHTVTTGLTLIYNKKIETEFASTKVLFRELSDKWILEYIKTDEPKGKAGAYAIQGIGKNMVLSITGSYTNVVGLPMELLKEMLYKFNPSLALTHTSWKSQIASTK